uniref:Ovule protein n=1 Tax=Romanomermis culicivorax TaxID=13658 RepID=A0A915KSA7_ROMCU
MHAKPSVGGKILSKSTEKHITIASTCYESENSRFQKLSPMQQNHISHSLSPIFRKNRNRPKAFLRNDISTTACCLLYTNNFFL